MEDEEPPEAMPPPAYEGLTLLDLLSRAQRALYATLLDRIESGTAGKEDIKVLHSLLVANGLTLQVENINRRMIDVTPEPIKLPNYKQDFNE